MSTASKRMLARLSIAAGLAFIIAGIGDYSAHLWRDAPSPHPVWAPMVMVLLGVLMLFPERLGLAKDWAVELLPWWRQPHDRRHDDPPGGEQ
jgi:hypothetical protein